MKEEAGDINAASELMQELQVETFGSMERREKVDFILEQMRLLKAQDDWEKMAIVAKRINLKWLGDKEHEVRFAPLPFPSSVSTGSLTHGGRVASHAGPQAALLLAHDPVRTVDRQVPRRGQALPRRVRDALDRRQRRVAAAVLRNVVYFLVLAPYDNEQSDLLNRVYKDDRLKEMKES